jgi:hypothetical protein
VEGAPRFHDAAPPSVPSTSSGDIVLFGSGSDTASSEAVSTVAAALKEGFRTRFGF